MEFCPHCMKPAQGDRCPYCGGDLHWTAAPQHLPVGTILKGQRSFQIGAIRGQGGFGVTYIALELGTGRRAAIKEYFPASSAQRAADGCTLVPNPGMEQTYQAGLDSFLQEAKLLSSVEQLPCVVHFWDYFQANGTAYLAMEYLDGAPLHQKVAQEGRIPAQALLQRLQPLLQDLGALHRAGIIHRDISPDNIMWMPDGTLKLLDFGCARSMADRDGMPVLLKHGFAPVEQYQTLGQGPWTDVYALSATIYYSVTGNIPPSALNRLEDETLPLPSSCGAQLSPQQEQALLWGLAVQPGARPQTVDAFAQRLYSAPIPQQGGQIPFPGPVPAQNPKKKTGAIIGGVAAGAAVVAIAAFLVFGRGDKTDAPALPDDTPTMQQPVYPEPAPVIEPTPTEPEPTEPEPTDPEPTEPEPTEPEPDDAYDGVTEDGYYYTISNGEATLTGYDGTLSGLVSMPDEVEDDIPITAIGDDAFMVQSEIETILMPIHLTRIGSGAFVGCTALKRVSFYNSLTAESDSFLGCDHLRCLFFNVGDEPLGDWLWTLTDCSVLYKGSELGLGAEETLSSVSVDEDGVIYGKTANDLSVLLDVPKGTTSLEVEPGTSWVAPNAFDSITGDLTVYMNDELTFPYELWSTATWNVTDLTRGGRAYNWLLSCALADEIYIRRDESGIVEQVAPTQELLELSMERAQELAESGELSWTRPDGTSWDTVLTGHSYDYAGTWQDTCNSNDVQYFTDAMDVVQEVADNYALKDEHGYYEQCGVALALGSDGKYYLASFLFVP